MMLSTVSSALVFVEKRGLFEVIPDSVIKFVNKWEVRLLILFSITLQILLNMLGNRRKYICRIWIRIILWSAYLLADSVATVALGVISKNTLDESMKGRDVELFWFWAQFLLLHLGGSDSITAYSQEDNELWLRHFVVMVIQTGLAFYVLLVAIPSSSWLPILSILIFIAGVIKYGERIWALRSAHSENFRDSMLTEPDPGPNYAKFMEEFTLKKAEGFYVEAAEVREIPVQTHHSFPHDNKQLIPEAYNLFQIFKRLFADIILSYQDRESLSDFKDLKPKEAFDVVEVELGFTFDVLYTKISQMYNLGAIVLRLVSFSLTFFALVAFLCLCDKSKYRKLDLAVTYSLLFVANLLEIYSAYVLLNSDWTVNWMSKRGSTPWWYRWQTNRRRWSKKMAQHNLLDLCLRDKKGVRLRTQQIVRRIHKLLQIENFLEKHRHKTYVDVSPELKGLIFDELKKHTRSDSFDPAVLWTRRGSFALEKYGRLSKGEFDQRILLWHIATDICYSLECQEDQNNMSPTCRERRKQSKYISDYMLYLLVSCPFMLPIGIGMMRFRDTCAEAREFLGERNRKYGNAEAEAKVKAKAKACEMLLQVNTEVPPAKVKGDRSKSVLFDACFLARSLLAKKEDRWNIISEVWVEMLACAATHCRGNHHASQLRKGGEFLTHVWLLMAHLGITEQFQINQGHARAKLIVK